MSGMQSASARLGTVLHLIYLKLSVAVCAKASGLGTVLHLIYLKHEEVKDKLTPGLGTVSFFYCLKHASFKSVAMSIIVFLLQFQQYQFYNLFFQRRKAQKVATF